MAVWLWQVMCQKWHMNILEMLRNDHAAVRGLFSKFDRTAMSQHERRGELFVQIRREWQIHSRAEEEIFYPAVKALDGTGMRLISAAVKQHERVHDSLMQISRLKPSDKSFDEMVETLLENVDHHIEEEEGEIFQFAEENCSPERLEDLGRQFEGRKRAIDRLLAA